MGVRASQTMVQTRYGSPYWPSLVSKAKRRPFPVQRGMIDTNVVIVGGGVTGCATAYAFAAAGIPVVLLESDRIGLGGTARDIGVVGLEPDVSFEALEAMYGRRIARRMWLGVRQAGFDLMATVRRLRIACGLNMRDGLQIARDPEEADRLRREWKRRRAAGIDASWIDHKAVKRLIGAEAFGAIRSPRQGQLDPYRVCAGLALAAARRGTTVCERSPVRRVDADRTGVVVHTDRGEVRADHVVIATSDPAPLVPSLARHVNVVHQYVVVTAPLEAQRRVGLGRRDAVVRDSQSPAHRLRWDSNIRIVFGGAEQRPLPVRRQDAALVQRTGQLMYELSTLYPSLSGVRPTHAWHVPVVSTADTLPLIGRHRHLPRHLLALGTGRNRLTLAMLAARALVRLHLEQSRPEDAVFGFGR